LNNRISRAVVAEALEIRRLLSSVSGTVFNDVNGNGRHDEGEPGIAGISVTLHNDNTGTDSNVTTDGNGVYTFNGLESGTCASVSLNPPAPWHLTTSSGGGIYFAGEGDAPGPDFGLSNQSSVSGTVGFDVNNDGTYSSGDSSMGGVSVWADTNGNGVHDEGEPITTTGSDGGFQLGNVPPASSGGTNTTIHVDPPEGWSPPYPGGNVISVDVSTGDVTGVSVVFNPNGVGSIYGNVFNDGNENTYNDSEPGLSDLILTLTASNGYSATTTTDEYGNYAFGGLTPRSYTIEVSVPDNWHATTTNPASAAVTVISGNPEPGYANFGLCENPIQYGSISGTIWDDQNANGQRDGEPGLSMVAVLATQIDSTRSDYGSQYYVITDGSGCYSFSGLAMGGSYQITVSISDRRPTDGSGINYVYNLNTDVPDVSGIDQGWTWGMITGIATTDSVAGSRVAGVGVSLLDTNGTGIAWATSGADGSYTFTNLDPSQSYSVIGSGVQNYRYSHGTYGVGISVPSLIGVGDVYLLSTPGVISGTVYEDADNDGTISGGDVGSGGWIIYDDENHNGVRDDTDPMTSSAADGTYTLSGLLVNQYHDIRVEPRAGWETPSGGGSVWLDNGSGEMRNGVDFLVVPERITVSVETMQGAASENNRTPGMYIVRAVAADPSGIDVFFDMTGTASLGSGEYPSGVARDGADYVIEGATPVEGQPLLWSVNIPSGETYSTVIIRPLNDPVDDEPVETAILTLQQSPAGEDPYSIQEGASVATVEIIPLKVRIRYGDDGVAGQPTRDQILTKIADLNDDIANVREAADRQLRAWLDSYNSLEELYASFIDPEGAAEINNRLHNMLVEVLHVFVISNDGGTLHLKLGDKASLTEGDVTTVLDSVPFWPGDGGFFEREMGGSGADVIPPGTTNLPALVIIPLKVTPADSPVSLQVRVDRTFSDPIFDPVSETRTFSISITEGQ
jgi:hypothetical protein